MIRFKQQEFLTDEEIENGWWDIASTRGNPRMVGEGCKPGDHHTFTLEELASVIKNYAWFKRRCPITLEHRQDGRAFGWVKNLRFIDDVLQAKFEGISLILVAYWKKGRYLKRSAEIGKAGENDLELMAVSFLEQGTALDETLRLKPVLD